MNRDAIIGDLEAIFLKVCHRRIKIRSTFGMCVCKSDLKIANIGHHRQLVAEIPISSTVMYVFLS